MLSILELVLIFALLFLSILILFLINFYRDPERKTPNGNNIVSPADGKVIRILKTKSGKINLSKGFFGGIETLAKDVAKECYFISIFMSPFDVHINRAPIDGKILSVKHEHGKFFAAYKKSSLQNEKNEILLFNKKIGRIKVIQIAGFLARRILCSVYKNQKVNKGQRIGKIVLGSQVVLIMPSKKAKVRVKKWQKVIAGKTILADY